jgi:hypothetical protein
MLILRPIIIASGIGSTVIIVSFHLGTNLVDRMPRRIETEHNESPPKSNRDHRVFGFLFTYNAHVLRARAFVRRFYNKCNL